LVSRFARSASADRRSLGEPGQSQGRRPKCEVRGPRIVCELPPSALRARRVGVPAKPWLRLVRPQVAAPPLSTLRWPSTSRSWRQRATWLPPRDLGRTVHPWDGAVRPRALCGSAQDSKSNRHSDEITMPFAGHGTKTGFLVTKSLSRLMNARARRW